jgi:hypothetical protein
MRVDLSIVHEKNAIRSLTANKTKHAIMLRLVKFRHMLIAFDTNGSSIKISKIFAGKTVDIRE